MSGTPFGIGETITGISSSENQRSAANTQADAQLNAQQMQYKMFEEQMNTPMNQALQSQGPNALNQLMSQYGNKQFSMQDFQNSPAYQSMMGANRNMLDNASAQGAASGMLGSGNFASALQSGAQQNALAGEQNAFNQYYQPASILQSVAGLSQNQNLGMGGLSQNAAYNMGQNMIGAGNAQAAGMIGQGNAWSNTMNRMGSGMGSGFQQGMNYYNNQNALYDASLAGEYDADAYTGMGSEAYSGATNIGGISNAWTAP